MGWGSILGAVGSIVGGGEQKEASAKAQEQAAYAQMMGTESQRRLYEEGQQFLDPFRQAGYVGLEAYEGAPMYEFTPEEQRRLQESQAGLQRVYSAQGKRKSGQAARGQMGLIERATADAYNRAYGRDLEAAGIGSQAAQAGAQQALGTGRGIASAYMQGAQNQIPYLQMQGQLAASNIAGLSSLGGSLANYYQGMGGMGGGGGVTGEDFLYGEEF
jgi:hypothetical protein